MTEVVLNPSFNPEDFDPSRKQRGVSAILRLKNEEEYLEMALDSIRPFFDEFVIVYNQCSDRTPDIVAEFARAEPQRVKAFHYVPKVFPPGSNQHRILPSGNVHSLVHYYNFALSKVSYRVCTKWDGDMIAAPDRLGQVIKRLRTIVPGTGSWWLSPWQFGYWWYSGVNLWDEDGNIYIPMSRPAAGRRKDIGFWPVGGRHIFRHYPEAEYLRTWWLKQSFVGFVFFHMKGMKKDRGIGVYEFDKYSNSSYRERIREKWMNPDLMSFEAFCRIEPAANYLPNPESLGIRPARRRSYKANLE
ncbi:MAG TPA: hypothetical protein VIE89_33520 [Candidatus Binatia bacterium]